MFGVGPTYLFLLQHRAPLGLMRGAGWQPWLSAMSTNAGIAIVVALLMWLIGPAPFLLIHGPIFMLAATIGVWLFYVQHQFETTHWTREAEWSLPEAALHGSSYYDLPPVLRWFSANIGVHHVHHLSSRVPFYRLREVLRDYPELKGRPHDAPAEPALRQLHTVGRRRPAADFVRRIAQKVAERSRGGVSGDSGLGYKIPHNTASFALTSAKIASGTAAPA